MADPRRATAIIVTRGSGADCEVLLVERSPALRFFGGYWAFPGGATEPVDAAVFPGDGGSELACCAIRELVEETQLVCDGLEADDAAVRSLVAALPASESAAQAWCSLLRRSPAAFTKIRPVCRITTPEFAPIRFTTEFVHVPLTREQALILDPGELVAGRFCRPADAVAHWTRGAQLIAPPVLFLLELLAQHGLSAFFAAAARAAAAFDAGAFHPVKFSPGIFMAPVPSPTLLPATTTNCLILGTARLFIVDPAAVIPAEQARLCAKIEEFVAAGAEVAGILLTHHHRDHVGTVALLSRRFAAPVHAHDLTYARLPSDDYLRGRPLQDGDVLPLGAAPDGTPDWRLEVLHTPGHARDHLCYIESRYHAAIVGDMVSTVSTILIDPPEGHMATYLRSLERLLGVPMTTLYPAHGPAARDGHTLIRHYLDHRRQREKMIREALSFDAQSLDALLPKAYGDVAPEARAVAERALLAGLEKLAEDGIALETEGRWSRAA